MPIHDGTQAYIGGFWILIRSMGFLRKVGPPLKCRCFQVQLNPEWYQLLGFQPWPNNGHPNKKISVHVYSKCTSNKKWPTIHVYSKLHKIHFCIKVTSKMTNSKLLAWHIIIFGQSLEL